MKYLAIDIGNTSVKAGFFKDTLLTAVHRFGSVPEVLSATGTYADMPVIIASVTHTEEELRRIFSGFSRKVFLSRQTPVPLQNAYESRETLGYDRLAAAVGANGRFPDQNCLIVDIGTAIKYDLVSAENAFVGGVISPGRKMRFQALHTFTKKLPLVDATDIPGLVGTHTEACLKSGVMNGIVAELNGMIASYMESYNPVVLLCGGDAPYFETQIKYPTFAAPNLVLEGLIRILLCNVAEA
ncbi:MAG: type III pantothenate kinase [Leadbetterella sp.]|nr:type III pantothenate kinase [Leadbetterella sp.]